MTRLLLLASLLLALAPTSDAQGCNIASSGGVSLSDIRPAPGQTITVSHVFVSVGSGPCPEVEVGHYFSTDDYFSDDDTLLGTVTLPASNPQSNLPASGEITVPMETPRGGYVVLAVANHLGTVDETITGDNTMRGGDLTVGGDLNGPDLLVVDTSIEDDTVAPGGRVSFEYSVLNQGETDVGDTVMGFYLRRPNTPPSEWTFLESEVVGGVEAGETEEEQEEVTIPSGTPPGTYAIIVVADDGNAIEESDETNNTRGVGGFEVTGTVATEGGADGAALALSASPNPTAGVLSLSYALASPSAVRLAVVDALGREVAVVAGARGAGQHAEAVDASRWTPGVYHVRLSAGDAAATRAVTVVR